MSKGLSTFFATVAIVLGLFLVIFTLRFEALRTQNDFLMKLVQLESATVADYEAEFGKEIYTARYGEPLHPDLLKVIEENFAEGQTAHFFPAHTIPAKYLIVVSNADGSVAWRTWLQM